MKKADIEFILNEFKGIVLIDEAYIDFADCTSFIHSINQYNNLIVSQTLSKAWGLAASRIGIAYMNKEVITYYNKVKAPYNISQINQEAAIDALNKKDRYEKNLAIILSEKDRVITELRSINLIKTIYPSDTNFILLEVDDADQLYRNLLAQQIITRNRAKEVSNCIRITIGSPQENTKLISALKSLL